MIQDPRKPRLPDFKTLAGLAALALSLAACGKSAGQTANAAERTYGNRLRPTQIHRDFGLLPLGTAKSMDIEIPIPESDVADVAPLDYSGNCRCATGMLMIWPGGDKLSGKPVYGLPTDQRILKKGDKVILRLKLDTKHKDPMDVAYAREFGFVIFEHISGQFSRKSKVPISFDFGIKTPIKVMPVSKIDFGELPMSGKWKQTLELSSNIEGQKLDLGTVHTSPSCISAHLEPRGDVILLHVEVTPIRSTKNAVPIYGTIAIATGLDDYTDLKIVVAGKFIGDISFSPSWDLSWNIFDFKEQRETFVTITDHDVGREPGFVVESFRNSNGVDVSRHFAVSFEQRAARRTRVDIKYLGTMGGKRMLTWLSLAKTPGGKSVAKVQVQGYNSGK